MDRLFLDANILFSAAYRLGAGLLRLWRLREVQLMTSDYALKEAQVNLEPLTSLLIVMHNRCSMNPDAAGLQTCST